MQPASNFRNSAAAPFCSHSKTINASLANYDTPGFKLGQLLETGAAEAWQRSDTVSLHPDRTDRNRRISLCDRSEDLLTKRCTANA